MKSELRAKACACPTGFGENFEMEIENEGIEFDGLALRL
jgi:hypothetical protein